MRILKFCFIFLVLVPILLGSCSNTKSEELTETSTLSEANTDLSPSKNTTFATGVDSPTSKMDLGLGYFLSGSDLFYGEDKMYLSLERKDVQIDYNSITPINYTFFKDSQYVYARFFQDPRTFDIVAGADPGTFYIPNPNRGFEGADKSKKFNFMNEVDSFGSGDLYTGSSPPLNQ